MEQLRRVLSALGPGKLSLSLIRVAVLALDGPDVGLIFFERVDVNHPVEDYGKEDSTRGVARFLRGDRSL